jgi:hypothetical protein
VKSEGIRLGEGRRDIQDVSWLDDQAPSCPDHTSSCEGYILGDGELLCGTREIGDTGEDETPLLKFCQRFVDTSNIVKRKEVMEICMELDTASCGTDR